MSREIKFRAWDQNERDMVQSFQIEQYTGEKYPAKNLRVRTQWTYYEDADELILMQYTGLKDSVGTEAYHKDILRWNDWEQELTEVPDVYIMEWDDLLGRWYLESWRDSKRLDSTDLDARTWEAGKNPLYDMTVVGNIFENKELAPWIET